ncbi:MerR family transcriptional regulator, partial [Vibrio sp. 2128(2023)]
ETVLSELVFACHARQGNVSCPLIASLQGEKEPRGADAV